jgi:hypothetical protein
MLVQLITTIVLIVVSVVLWTLVWQMKKHEKSRK